VHFTVEWALLKKMTMKILKNLLIYPGSSRRAFGAPQDDGPLRVGFEK
jgi:hypothetical protein